MSIKSALTDLAKKMPALRFVMREVRFAAARAAYLPRRINGKPDPELFLFESYNGHAYACSPRAIYEAMLRDSRFDSCRFVWAFKEPGGRTLPDTARTSLVTSGSAEYFDICSKAGYIVINSSFAEGVTLKKGQTLLQTWHGTPLKRLGFDLDKTGGDKLNSVRDNRRRYALNAKRFSYLISPSPECSRRLRTAFGLDRLGKQDIIRETGYPRNDMLYTATQSDIAAIRERFGIAEGKRVALYAPTYRDNAHQSGVGYIGESMLDFDKLRKALGEDWVILFRPHYFIANAFDFSRYAGFVINAAETDEVSELYLISDVLITDYSSVFFDYANLRHPMIFYMYDMEQYSNEIRGFYSDCGELPGPMVHTQEALTEELLSLQNNPQIYADRFGEKYELFRRKYNPLDDGKAAERVLDLLR